MQQPCTPAPMRGAKDWRLAWSGALLRDARAQGEFGGLSPQSGPQHPWMMGRTETTDLPPCLDSWHSSCCRPTAFTLQGPLLAPPIFPPVPPESQVGFWHVWCKPQPLRWGQASREPPEEHRHGSTTGTGKAGFPLPSLGRTGRCRPIPERATRPSPRRQIRMGGFGWRCYPTGQCSVFPSAVGCVPALPGKYMPSSYFWLEHELPQHAQAEADTWIAQGSRSTASEPQGAPRPGIAVAAPGELGLERTSG